MPYKNLAIKRTHASWRNMRARCYDKKHPHYAIYGGRGIVVCERWLESFYFFLEDMGERPDERVLDRLDNALGYSKENCRWATHKESTANRSNTITLGTERVNDMAARLGIPASRIYHRLDRGWTAEEIEKNPQCIYNGDKP